MQINRKIIRTFIIGLLAIPVICRGAIDLHITQARDDAVQIEVVQNRVKPDCLAATGRLFGEELGIKKISDTLYVQKLNSEVGENAVYLKAAKMGEGIYMHLPYFVPEGCKAADFKVSAAHILWDGKWYGGQVSIPAAAVEGKSIFFTNEAAPVIKSAGYYDSSILGPMLARLETAFERVISTYKGVFRTDPMVGVGTVVAIVRNAGNYSGFGGDALNIIRMSYDNPTPEHMLTLDRVFPSTFAHELAHKLQSETLFERPHARYIVEGSADFLKLVVLRSAGLVDDAQTKGLIRKAAADCAQFADERTLIEKSEQGAMRFREPYDCGMVYYVISYYASGLEGPAFLAALRQAVSGRRYGDGQDSLCLLFESTCRNERLRGASGNKRQLLEQLTWLEGQLASRPSLMSGSTSTTQRGRPEHPKSQ